MLLPPPAGGRRGTDGPGTPPGGAREAHPRGIRSWCGARAPPAWPSEGTATHAQPTPTAASGVAWVAVSEGAGCHGYRRVLRLSSGPRLSQSALGARAAARSPVLPSHHARSRDRGPGAAAAPRPSTAWRSGEGGAAGASQVRAGAPRSQWPEGPVLVLGPGDTCRHGPGGGWTWTQPWKPGPATAAALQNQGKHWGPGSGSGEAT
ncbi:spidroin-2-like [Vulpes lagopus]|uniref:spidroin-2-like n=1 Tax=Vulpes lagopus TaxID=494514 RepID=UPI001BC950E3|nr:spidroin-2-like [Vulpes lagopus]